jgi:hypothetical protein
MECPHPSIHPGEQRPTFPSESGALWPAEPHQASYVTDWTVQQADLVSPFKVVVQAARGRHPRKIRANPRGVIHKSPVYLTTLISGKKGAKNDVKGCPKRRLLHRVDHVTVSRFFLACCSQMPRKLLPFYPPSLSPLLQAQNGFPTTYAPDLSKTVAYAAYRMDRFNYKYGRPAYFLLASSPLQHANRPHNFLTQSSLNYLSPPKASQFGKVLVSAKLHNCWSY